MPFLKLQSLPQKFAPINSDFFSSNLVDPFLFPSSLFLSLFISHFIFSFFIFILPHLISFRAAATEAAGNTQQSFSLSLSNFVVFFSLFWATRVSQLFIFLSQFEVCRRQRERGTAVSSFFPLLSHHHHLPRPQFF